MFLPPKLEMLTGGKCEKGIIFNYSTFEITHTCLSHSNRKEFSLATNAEKNRVNSV